MTYDELENIWDLEPITYDCYQDSDYFNHNFIPTKMPHRLDETNTIANYIRPILLNKKPNNLLITGNTSMGKTTAIKRLFNSFNNNTNKAYCSYINCQINTTITQIYLKIYENLTKETIIENKGSSELLNMIMHYLKKENKGLIVCLDDLDSYFKKKDISKILNQLLRIHEEEGILISLIIITNKIDFYQSLDTRASSIFSHEEVSFKDYTINQTYDILKERCYKGFCKNVIQDEQIKIIANYCHVFKDIRCGLDLLMELGNMINADNDCKIRDNHIDIVIERNMAQGN